MTKLAVDMIAILSMVCFFSGMCATAGAKVTLIEQGEPQAVIVLPGDPLPGEQQAADELVEHLAVMSGTTLPVLTEGEELNGRLPIRIGRAADAGLAERVLERQRTERPHWNVQDRIDEGHDTFAFALWVTDEDIQLRGGMGDAGTRTAAYELLEQLGIRWFMPGDEVGRHVPRRETVYLARQETIQVPSFVNRRGPQRPTGDARFNARIRSGGLGSQPGRHGFPLPDGRDHRYWREARPELFALHPDGTRSGAGQMCVSTPETLELVVRGVRELLERQEAPADTRRIVSVGPYDGGTHCHCEGCRALDAPDHITTPFGGPPAPSRTDRYVWFCNRILEALTPDYPYVRLGMYAYRSHELPPVNVAPSGRLAISIAPIRQCRHHGPNNPVCPESNYPFWLAEQWQPHADEIWDRGYIFNLADPGFPISLVHRLREEIPGFYERGIVGVVPSFGSTFATYNPGPYLFTRLAWDHTADVDALLEEFYTLFYGPARQPMAAYHALIDASHRDGDFHAGASWAIPDFYPAEVRNRLRRYLERAETIVADAAEVYQTRVAITRTGFDYLDTFCELMAHRNAHRFREEKAALVRLQALRDRMLNDFEVRVLDVNHARFVERFIASITDPAYETLANGGRIVAALSPEWSFYLDSERWGEHLRLMDPANTGGYWQTIRTDQPWSTQGLHHHFGQSWYRQRVHIPTTYAGESVRLWFAGVNRVAEVWVNGTFVGANHDGAAFDIYAFGAAFRPFEFDVTEAVAFGAENTVVVRSFRRDAGEIGTGGLIGPVMFYAPGDAEAEQRGDRN